MNINEALNEIIFKYHLDRYYPHYKNMYWADKILRDVVRDIIKCGKKAVFVGSDGTEIDLVRKLFKGYQHVCFCLYDRNDTSLNQFEDVSWQDYEEIHLISFYGAEHAERWFRLHHIKCEWIYDIFEREGILMQRPFYAFGKEDLYTLIVPCYEHVSRDGWTESFQCELYCQRSKYENASNSKTRQIALERCLFLALYMRNFAAAQHYVSLLMQESEDSGRFQCLWDEIQSLLAAIRERIGCRNQKDIILYWIDAIPYGDEKEMPYLQTILQDAVVFENAFTYVANTRPTLRAMFMGKKDIDDLAYQTPDITYDNSPVIQFLEEQGYGIRAYTGYFADNFPYQYLSDYYYMDQYETISMKIWNMMADMLEEETKMLWIVHGMESHPPCLNARLSDSNYSIGNECYRLTRLEMDEQLAFYDSMINQNAFRIFMSDHGRNSGTVHTDRKLRFHILFNIYHPTLKPARINGFFSLLDFGTVLKQIILDGRIHEAKFLREYIEIGYMDLYSYAAVRNVVEKKIPLSTACFGYKGIVDKEYVYVRYKMGKEWLQRRDNMPSSNPQLFYDYGAEVCEPALLPYYRDLVGGYPEGMDEDEKFKYSKYLYAIYHNILKNNHVTEYIGILNHMVERYPSGCVAVRMGGLHSKMLYTFLSEENKRKIWGFIDNNRECQCSVFHLPIVSLEQFISSKGIAGGAVLLSSYDYLDELMEEIVNYPAGMDVLNLYSSFIDNGIPCEGNFWEVKITDEDYDVGFPLN